MAVDGEGLGKEIGRVEEGAEIRKGSELITSIDKSETKIRRRK